MQFQKASCACGAELWLLCVLTSRRGCNSSRVILMKCSEVCACHPLQLCHVLCASCSIQLPTCTTSCHCLPWVLHAVPTILYICLLWVLQQLYYICKSYSHNKPNIDFGVATLYSNVRFCVPYKSSSSCAARSGFQESWYLTVPLRTLLILLAWHPDSLTHELEPYNRTAMSTLYTAGKPILL